MTSKTKGRTGRGGIGKMKPNSRNPIGKAIEMLVWFVETDQPYVGVREIATALEMSPSNAHRILGQLAEVGFVAQETGSQRYGLGVEFFRVAQLGSRKLPIKQAALVAMRRLVDVCNETALLALYDRARHEMFFAASVESNHSLRYAVDLNKWIPTHTGASGLAILAFLSPPELEAFLADTRLEPVTSSSITNAEELEIELERVHLQGFALTRGQRIAGAVGLAAPIFDGSGQVVGDICLTIPETRFDQSRTGTLLEALQSCVSEINQKIAGPQARRQY
ncbi:MAG: IclR family transcriptional regulator [Hyphomicrobiales bacterium]|nr:IclR family transcriptional regulator [Hyphomicrobiales bacterium]